MICELWKQVTSMFFSEFIVFKKELAMESHPCFALYVNLSFSALKISMNVSPMFLTIFENCQSFISRAVN